ncbi:rhodanese-like domain-containing protein [Candidatus Tisiphia endosymbiont of Nemotelus uliginosus]|uniref:oxygen-dependent tRNA uridine(34) hydroxylase TrhO n=1 Tax=Candidatus Tisiphia endosymbiont of Nemotelus uliginosus TaxID=3077926 RepID=UPI0035C8E655
MDHNVKIVILSFYSFVNIKDLELILPKILYIGKKLRVRGTILLAYEGFNGSVSGIETEVKLLLQEIIKLTAAPTVNSKVNYCDKHPFHKLKVKLKKEIISMAIENLDTSSLKGEYIEPKDWDKFISQDDVVAIDTRNRYETTIGSFKGSLVPNTDTFKQFPNWLIENKELFSGKKIAMFCTGGIRCEKSTAFSRTIGLKEVYHLKGGILQYLAETNNNNNVWYGECFVFDDRRAVASDLAPAAGYWLERK